ncbi:MAG: hypothetical protein WBP26_03755 [Candidatus Saccharimonadales bacterium]
MQHVQQGLRRIIVVAVALASLSSVPVQASPFGQGVFGADVPFGSITSLAINLGGNVSLTLNPDGSNLRGDGSHTITVTSTDVVGYQLFARSNGSSDMVNSGGAIIPASSNGSFALLSLNSWGYNLDASSDYRGMSNTPTLIKDTSGPAKSGDNTTVTYGAFTDSTQESGAYTTSVTYTVVAENQ